ncbi:hypothetical protein BSKO_02438 [Bryopsis sp. KO-2023]|nr:hypothetical protein BSKO_02438 [Bryopsis sp. KO-2023]
MRGLEDNYNDVRAAAAEVMEPVALELATEAPQSDRCEAGKRPVLGTASDIHPWRERIALDALIFTFFNLLLESKQEVLVRRLLKAACYGIALCKGYPNSKLHQHCLKVRVLNTIREPTVGIPQNQMDSLTIPVIVSRLVNAHKHLFALRVCEAVGMWACARIPADECTTDDVTLKDIIVDKLSDWDGIRYATRSTLR